MSQPDAPSLALNGDRIAYGLLDGADARTKAEFACHCLHDYKEKGWAGTALSKYFSTDIARYSKEDISAIKDSKLRLLRDLLRGKVVYVGKSRDIKNAKALFDAVRAGVPWPNT